MGSVFVEFYQQPVRMGAASDAAGRDIYETQDYVRFHMPGGQNIIERHVREQDKIEHAKKWAAYQAKREQVDEGTPIEQWAFLDVGRVATYKAARIFTVEQLADLSDEQAQRILGLGWHDLRQKARDWLDTAKGSSAPIERLNAENERLRVDLQIAQTQIEELKQLMAELQAQSGERKKRA